MKCCTGDLSFSKQYWHEPHHRTRHTKVLSSRIVAQSASPPRVRHSIPRGDVVLANLPLYGTQPWLSNGVVHLSGLLRSAGLRARVLRPRGALGEAPTAVFAAAYRTFLRDPTMAERLDAMARCYDEVPWYFDEIVDALLEGGESVIALSVFRNSVDVTLQVTRLLKARAPSRLVVLGGPEAIEEPEALRLPWIDVVVGRGAERVWLPLVRALLDRRPRSLPAHPSLWYGDALAGPRLVSLASELPPPPPSSVDYASLISLVADDDCPTMPVFLNLGCPYRCGFCSNHNLYGEFARGESDLVFEQIEEIVAAWSALGSPRNLSIQFSDATTNVLPQQFEQLLARVAKARKKWSVEVSFRGQVLLDRRVTEEGVRLWNEAGFDSVFFGLDATSEGMRRDLGKPGTAAQVAEALRAFQRGGGRKVFMGVPIGIPGATEADFEANAAFVEFALGLGVLGGVTLLPYMFFLQGQDPALTANNTGERRGLLWRIDVPGGDPAVRARRTMDLFDRVDGRVCASTPFPPEHAWPMMLPDADPDELARWFARHGAVHDQFAVEAVAADEPMPFSPARGAAVEGAPVLDGDEARSFAPLWESALADSGWSLDGIQYDSLVRDAPAVVLLLTGGQRKAAVALQSASGAPRGFARTRRFAVSYLSRWHDHEFVFDQDLMARIVDTLQRWERSAARAG